VVNVLYLQSAMSIEIDAIYEKGSLKLDHPLPLDEQQRVRVVVQAHGTVARRSYGIIGWKGDAGPVRQAALDPAASVLESA
jgi:predicted DNA-binding antitoxin AbrB/MazE fold protein